MHKENLKVKQETKINLPRGDASNFAAEFSDKLEPLEPLDLSKIKNFDELAKAMCYTAFTGRQLGEAVDVLEAMYKDKECFKILTLSGAMTMAKMGLVICDMIDNGMVDTIVSTGALMGHGFVEAVGLPHYKNPGNISDEQLWKLDLNRVYDTLEPEKNLDYVEEIIAKVLEKFDASKPTCSYEISKALGKYLYENAQGRGILKSAYIKNVPVFIPAFTDSEVGLDFSIFNKRKKAAGEPILSFDPFLDLDYYTELVFNSKKTGIFTIGGGVPRNWAQQVAPYLDILRHRIIEGGDPSKWGLRHLKNSQYYKPFTYAVRICPEPVHWGGLSGCTYSESVSWGKIVPKSEGGRFAEVLADATLAWPIILKAVMERLGKK